MWPYKVTIPNDASVEDRTRLAKLNNEFSKEYFWRLIDGGLFIFMIGLFIGSVVILEKEESEPKLIEWVDKYFYPLITLILGYITGKAVRGTSSEKPTK
jgi:hypothetical protein